MKNKEEKFEIIVRALIQYNGKILVCRNKEKNYYFLPGGHIDFGESAESALSRELKEELDVSLKKYSFIGVVENVYSEDNQKHHEINLVFEVKTDKVRERSKENHIDFFFFNQEELKRRIILPLALKNAMLKWCQDKKVFWASEAPTF